MLTINVVTIFPEFFAGPLSLSIPGRAAAAGAVRYNIVDLRDFTHDRHRTVDDYPYGGGAGMVMKPEPFFEAVDALGVHGPVVLVSARGRRFTHADAVRFSSGSELTLLCGHYKDVDQRVAEHLATEEISLGDFVLSGGEPAALAIIDAVVRLLPGAMSDQESARTDSFYENGLSAPSYTRPPEYRGHAVPEVLLSGDHAKIAAWRRDQGRALTERNDSTATVRPASSTDSKSVLDLLVRCELPTDGVSDRFPDGYSVAVTDSGALVGTAGVERYGTHSLLRSVAVDPAWRGRGLAERLTTDRMQWAQRGGARTMYLLTTTAADYFGRRGFQRIAREEVPAEVQSSSEFTTVCPTSAAVMMRELTAAD
jgi:tRNA (guanine37-N1)-methyltransferase